MTVRMNLKANVGIVLRGEVVALRGFAERLDVLIAESEGVQLVHKHLSASKLWIREGGEMNEEETA